MSDIARKAQGVFLWVDLVVKTLIKGLKNDDSLEQLEERLASTPTDIEAVYANMLSKIDKAHYKEAARLFQMTFVGMTQSLLDVALVLYDHSDRISESCVSDTLKLCHRAQNRIPTICGGLLDINEDNNRWVGSTFFDGDYLCLPANYTCSSDMAEISNFERYVHINFIHRTAYEFLSQNKQGQLFLNECPQPRASPYASIVKARLAKVRLLGLPEMPSNMDEMSETAIKIAKQSNSVCVLPIEERWDQVSERNTCGFINGLMHLLRKDEWLSGSASLSTCHDVDCTLTAVYRRNQIGSLFEHWSMQWGSRTRELVHSSSWSMMSEPSKYLDAQSARMEPIKNRPVDFLGHAASWCLSSYVIERYDEQKKSMKKDYATYLLCCSMWPLSNEFSADILLRSLDLVADLLNRGGNPNLYVKEFSTTIWGHFIGLAIWGYSKVREKLLMTTKTFVEKGADIHMTLLSELCISWSLPEGQVQSVGKSPCITLLLEMSILRYLQSHRLPSHVVEVLRAKGGQIYSKYTHISTNIQTNGLSKRQHDKWLAALNKGQLEYIDGVKSLRKLYRFAGQFRRYCEDNPEEDEDSDVEINWEGDDDQDVDLRSLDLIEKWGFKTKPDLEESQPIEG